MAYRCVYRIHVPRTQSSRSFGSDISHYHLLQEIAWNLGGTVAKCERREYGFARVQISKFGSDRSTVDALFEGLGDEMEVRRTMSRSRAADWGLGHEGMDVSWRPDLCASSGFPHHWPHDIRALCRHRPQCETTLRHTISSGGDALSTGKGGDLPIRSQRLWLQKQLDYGMDKYIYTLTFVIEALYDATVGGVYREGSCSHP